MKRYKRIISLLLASIMLISLVQPAGAYMTDTPASAAMTLTDKDGNTVTVDDSWTTAFPYGTFAFDKGELNLKEGEGEKRITVYRLGGTIGKATVYISLTPVVTAMDEGATSTVNAAGINDFSLKVEDTLPIAAYQKVGRDPDPLKPASPVAVARKDNLCTPDVLAADGTVSTYGNTVFSVDVLADSYQWQIYLNAAWKDVDGAVEQMLPVSNEHTRDYDYRCIFTMDGLAYGSDSANGEPYESVFETVPAMPGDLALNPETAFANLRMQEGEFDTYHFDMTFAEGEWKKELILTPIDDAVSETVEFVALTLEDCEGGTLYDTANTLLAAIADNEEVLPSFAGFGETTVKADKAGDKVLLNVHRSGALQHVFSIDYKTVDRTAMAGSDYADTSGTLYFSSGVEDLAIEIPLIDDGIPSPDSHKVFTVELSNPKGGGKDSAILEGTAVVSLYNSAIDNGETNLETMLYTPEADDPGDALREAAASIVGNGREPAPVTAVDSGDAGNILYGEYVDGSSDGGFGLMTRSIGHLGFTRGNLAGYDANYWKNYALIGKYGGYFNYDVNDVSGYMANAQTFWTAGQRYGNGWEYYVEDLSGDTFAYFNKIANFGQLFKSVSCYLGSRLGYNWSNGFYSKAYFGVIGGKYTDIYRNAAGAAPYDIWNRYFQGDIGVDTTGLYLQLGIEGKKWYHTGTPSGHAFLLDGVLLRRSLGNDLEVKIHTADDAAISASSSAGTIYAKLLNKVGMVQKAGGVNASGKPYIGSTLSVPKPLSDVYSFAVMGGKMDKSVYLSAAGQVGANDAINTGIVTSEGGTLSLVAAAGKTLTESSGNDYALNVVLNRDQFLKLDMAPSIPREVVVVDNVSKAGVALNMTRAAITYDNFWDSISPNHRITCRVRSADPSSADNFGAQADKTLGAADFGNLTGTAATSKIKVQNLQSVNFHLPHADQILFNGYQYAGDADIPIPVDQLDMNILTFSYYQADYVSVESNMTLTVSRIEQYVDANGNGQLDGFVNDLNVFVPEAVVIAGHPEGVRDELTAVLSPKDYSVTQFGPVLDSEGNTRKQFFKLYYNMLPRCLTVPEGASMEASAQILPAFVSNITNESVKSSLSDEMKGYRFVTSGVNSVTGRHTADYKLMYTALANRTESVDIPLGGDTTPVEPTYVYKNPDNTQTESKTYDAAKVLVDVKYKRSEWNPTYEGDLLYTYSDPTPLFIDDSLVGKVLPVADEDATAPRGYRVSDLNAFLGSFSADNTVALCIREQKNDTDVIESWYGDSGLSQSSVRLMEAGYVDGVSIEVDSANPSGTGSIPGSEGLQNMSGQDGTPDSSMDSNASSSSMKEFNMDLGLKLPSLSFGLSDYMTVIMDGYEVGFSIGIPVFKASKSTESYTSSDKHFNQARSKYGKTEVSGPMGENKGSIGKIWNSFANPKKLLNSTEWQQAQKAVDKAFGGDKLAKSSGMEFSVGVNVTVMFKYSSLDNTYKFTSAMVFLKFSFQYKFTARLVVCPIVYAYFVVGVSLEASGGVLTDRVVEENKAAAKDIAFTSSGQGLNGIARADRTNGTPSAWTMLPDANAAGGTVAVGNPGDAFTTGVTDAFNLRFRGTLKVEYKQQGAGLWNSLGFVKSDGAKEVTVMLDEKVDGNGQFDIRITVLDAEASIDTLVPISRISNDTYFSGVSLTPGIFMEVGVGIGVECLKIEVFFKASITCTFSFWSRTGNSATKGIFLRDPSTSSLDAASSTTREAFSFDSMMFRAGLGVRITALLFSFEIDAIQFGIDYSKGYNQDKYLDADDGSSEGYHSNGWKFAWYTLNSGTTITSYDLSGADDSEGFPGLKITVPANTFWTQTIYGPENSEMVLDELDALAYDPENLEGGEFQISGYSSTGDAFKLATGLATGTDYQLLTVGDANYLAYTISRPTTTSAIDANMLVLSKLVNTGLKVGLENPVDSDSPVRYILMDRKQDGSDDGTGDLDFSAWVTGDTIHAAWVSYASVYGSASDALEKPVVSRPVTTIGGISVAMDGENYTDSRFEPVAPVVPTEPIEPVLADFEADPAYPTPEAALAAYQEAKSAYDVAKAAYDVDKAAYDLEKAAYDGLFTNYGLWYAYFRSAAERDAEVTAQLKTASRNTVVKTAFFDAGSLAADNAFSQPKIISGMKADLVTPATGNYVFLPEIGDNGDVVFFGRTGNFTADELAESNAEHKAYYDASKGTAATNASGVTTGGGDPAAGFRYAYNTSMNDVYGKNTDFCFAVRQADGSYTTAVCTLYGWADVGMRLDNVAMTMSGVDSFYMAYTASRTEIEAGVTGYTDKTVHKLYLQKGTLSTDGSGKRIVTLGTAALLRTLVDITDNDSGVSSLTDGLIGVAGASTPDGVYKGMNQSVALEDPYFGNLKFLKGALGALTGEEEDFTEALAFSELTTLDAMPSTFLLFEISGTSHVIPESSLEGMTAADAESRKGMIIPFFAATGDNGTKGNVCIGTDGDGNISAVYTDTVPNTGNNAIYVTKYDAATKSFGEGRMLAMNHMQVYEDGLAQSLDPDETEASYLDPAKGGGMDSFVFTNLEIALGLTKTTLPDDLSQQSASPNPNPVMEPTPENSGLETTDLGTTDLEILETATRSTLLILAQGTRTELERKSFLGNGAEENEQVVLPKYDANGKLASTTGYYAISFGVGEKNVGEGTILFHERDFVPGAFLLPAVGFRNTGDMPLLGSEANPITVQLWISGPPVTSGGAISYDAGTLLLNEWKVEGGIPVGGTFNSGDSGVDTESAALPKSLGGRKFYFTVSEDASYVDEAFYYSSLTAKGGTTITVEDKPELAIEDMSVTTVGTDGDNVILGVDLFVTNRGTKDSSGAYLQFSRQSGADADNNGNPVYSALDIRVNDLSVGMQQPVMGTQDLSTAAQLQQGLFMLYGEDDDSTDAAPKYSNTMKAGYGRTVKGTITLPKDSYCDATATGSLNLKIEVFDENAIVTFMDASGLRTFDHSGELNNINNTGFVQLEASSFFAAPANVSVVLGTTMKLFLPVTTTRKTKPIISVTELNSQAEVAEQKNLGVLQYRTGIDAYGLEFNYLVISPAREGTGIIRVADTATGEFVDIAYTVTQPGSGVNIYKDNDIFTWYDTRGAGNVERVVDPDDDPAHAWTFQEGVKAWGPVGQLDEPYSGDLSRSTAGRYFRFVTLAESIDLYFTGAAEVTSSFPGFTGKTVTASGGGDESTNHATIRFGDNPNNYPHTVTVKVLSDEAAFDRLTEHFSGNRIILPSDDGVAPGLYWSRIMPETASLDQAAHQANGYTLTVYAIDETGLSSVVMDSGSAGAEPSGYVRHSDSFSQFDITVRMNGTFNVRATDSSGNTTTRTITVDWFNSVVTQADAPLAFTADTVFIDGDGNPLGAGYLAGGQEAWLRVGTEPAGTVESPVSVEAAHYDLETVTTTASGITLSSIQGSFTPLSPEEGRYRIEKNGIYKVTASNGHAGCTRLLFMNKLDPNLPKITLAEVEVLASLAVQPFEKGLEYTVMKGMDSPTPISAVKLNGQTLAIPSGQTWLSGIIPIAFSGSYVMEAWDGAGNKQASSITMGGIAIDAGADGVFTVQDSWNRTRNNGSITVDSTKIKGGSYDAGLSTPASGSYAGSYEYYLVPESQAYMQQDEEGMGDDAKAAYRADRASWLASGQWQAGSTFTGMAPGSYRIYVRDRQDPDNADVVTSQAVTVGDGIVQCDVAMKLASRVGADDGMLEIMARGGRNASGTYEFALLKLETGESALAELSMLSWDAADDENSLSPSKKYESLSNGWYQFAAREKGLDYTIAENYQNAATGKIYLYFIPASTSGMTEIPIITYSDEFVDVVFSGTAALAPYLEALLVTENKDKTIRIAAKGLRMTIPAGTLAAGDNVNDMIVSIDRVVVTPGTVVQYSDADGNIHPLCFSFVTGSMVAYIASSPGIYKIVDGGRLYKDLKIGHWASDSVLFCSARGLFNGTSADTFTPDGVMSRAMFVTLLGRIHGIKGGGSSGGGSGSSSSGNANGGTSSSDNSTNNSANNSASNSANNSANNSPSRFSDVSAGQWYSDAILWAYENGIASGVGNGRFAPGKGITREQMCVMMVRYLDYAGIRLKLGKTAESAFQDEGEISGWARDAVLACRRAGIVSGTGSGRFNPKGSFTRAQAAVFFSNVIRNILQD